MTPRGEEYVASNLRFTVAQHRAGRQARLDIESPCTSPRDVVALPSRRASWRKDSRGVTQTFAQTP